MRRSLLKYYETHDAPFKNHRHTEEAKEKNRQFHKGKKHSKETKQKIGIAAKKYTQQYGVWNKGVPVSRERKAALRDMFLGAKSVMYGKVTCLDINQDRFVVVSKEEYQKYKNIRYYHTCSMVSKKWRKNYVKSL